MSWTALYAFAGRVGVAAGKYGAGPRGSAMLAAPAGTDVAFNEEIAQRPNADDVFDALNTIWQNRVPKANAMGIPGVLFYGLMHKRQDYPALRDEAGINRNGSRRR